MKKLSLFILLVCCVLQTYGSSDSLSRRVILFDNARSEVPYRIPALAQNKAGDMIAVVDYRYSGQDIGMADNGKVDLRYRIRDHKNGNWGEIQTLVAAFGEGPANIAFGDPCIVADRESDLVLVTSCCGNVSFPKGTHENHQGWAKMISTDGGSSWSEYEDISPQVFEQLDRRHDGEIRCFFIGSGKIKQSDLVKPGDFYRLYCSALVKTHDKKNVNYVFYSDDFGNTWKVLGDVNDCPVPEGGDEAKVEELPDGSVLVSSRVKGGRLFNIFRFSDMEKGEGCWEEVAFSSEANNGVRASANACNGEVLIVPAIDNVSGQETVILLQSVPLGPEDRSHVGINFKVLDNEEDYSSPAVLATGWDGVFEVTDRSSAYSTMILNSDKNISFLFEENVYNGGYDIVYDEFTLPEITAGKFSAR